MKKLVSAELKMRDLSPAAREYYDGTDERVYEDILNEDAFYIGYDRANTSGPYTFQELDDMFCEFNDLPWWETSH